MVMHKDSVLIYNYEKGFGEVFWITCLVCWSSTRYVIWEDGTTDEHCAGCLEKEGKLIRRRWPK